MQNKRFSVRLAATGREVAMADTEADADMAIATLVADNGGRQADYEVFDNAGAFKQAKLVTTDGADAILYVIEEREQGGFVAVDDPFAKMADQVAFVLAEDGIVYEYDETADTFTKPLGTWQPLWVNLKAAL